MATATSPILPDARNHVQFLFWSPQEAGEDLTFCTDSAAEDPFLALNVTDKSLEVDTINPYLDTGITIAGVVLSSSDITAGTMAATHVSLTGTLYADTIAEKTSANGVYIDGVAIKDSYVVAYKFFPQTRPNYTLYTYTEDRALSGSTNTELFNVVSTLIADLIQIGLLT